MPLNTVSTLGIGVDDAQQARGLVVLDERLGLRLEHLEPLADHFFLVVRPLNQALLAAALFAVRRAVPGGDVYTLNTRPQPSQIRRPVRRLNRMPRSRFNSTTASSGCRARPAVASSASACAMLRGKPSRMKPLARRAAPAARGSCRARWHRRPACPRPWPPSPAGRARSPSLTASRSKSPVDICGTP